jgi:hypothetical protein
VQLQLFGPALNVTICRAPQMYASSACVGARPEFFAPGRGLQRTAGAIFSPSPSSFHFHWDNKWFSFLSRLFAASMAGQRRPACAVRYLFGSNLEAHTQLICDVCCPSWARQLLLRFVSRSCISVITTACVCSTWLGMQHARAAWLTTCCSNFI